MLLWIGCDSSLTQTGTDRKALAPPWTDYCAMMARDIQGVKPGFMAGNKMLYLAGESDVEWNIVEQETVGLTGSFFYDGRCRGMGIYPTEATGSGHDFFGWEFYREVAIAYGTVIINGERHEFPVPKEMIWRADRLICRYDVGDVKIEEHKFISLKVSRTSWTQVKTARGETNGQVVKTVTIRGNTQETLSIQPWLEGRELIEKRCSLPADASAVPRGHVGFSCAESRGKSVQVTVTLGSPVP